MPETAIFNTKENLVRRFADASLSELQDAFDARGEEFMEADTLEARREISAEAAIIKAIAQYLYGGLEVA